MITYEQVWELANELYGGNKVGDYGGGFDITLAFYDSRGSVVFRRRGANFEYVAHNLDELYAMLIVKKMNRNLGCRSYLQQWLGSDWVYKGGGS